MAELSREAMTLMELSPIWQRRERYQDAPAADAHAGSGLLIAVLAPDAPSRALWQRIMAVLIGLGFPRAVLEQSIIVQAPQADVLTHRLHQQRPAHLLVLGEGLLQAARSTDAGSLEKMEVIAAPSLSECLSNTQAKRRLWVLLSALHRQLSDGTSPPQ